MGRRSGLARRGFLGTGAVVAGTAPGAAFRAAYGDPEVPPPGPGLDPVSTISGTVPTEDLILDHGKIPQIIHLDGVHIAPLSSWKTNSTPPEPRAR